MSPNLLQMLLCLLLGGLLRVSGRFPKQTPQALNGFVIWVSLPALVLTQIPALLASTRISGEMLVPLSLAWIQFPLAFAFIYALGKHFRWDRRRTGALILTAGLGNTSFVGFPLLEFLLGPEATRIGVLVDQPGSFLVLSTLGILTASLWSPHAGKRMSAASVARTVLTFPPILSLIAAVIWHASGAYAPGIPTVIALERLAGTLVPIALVTVGFQLKVSTEVLRRQWSSLVAGLGFKLALCPLFFLALYVGLFRQSGFATHVTLLESAMAPMITAAVVAEDFGLDHEVASLMVGIGIPLSLLSVPAWDLVFSRFV